MKTVTRGAFLTLLAKRKPAARLEIGAEITLDKGSAVAWFDNAIEQGRKCFIGVTNCFVWLDVEPNDPCGDVRELRGQQ